MNHTFRELGFKAGDKVRCKSSRWRDYYKAGDEFTLKEVYNNLGICEDGNGYLDGRAGDWELVDDYEDKWELNDGTVEIPEDADTLTKNGSVVVFRRKKRQLFKRGDKVEITGEYKDGLVLYDEKEGYGVEVHFPGFGTKAYKAERLTKLP